MTWIDRWIQKQRINRVIRYIPHGSTVLDIGCFQGELFQVMGKALGKGFGIDPLLNETVETPRFTLVKGLFPDDWQIKTKLDCITMLAVLEHIPSLQQPFIAKKNFDLLQPGGLVILTVPSKKADLLLNPLKRMGIIQGMSLEEHYGFDPADTKNLFEKAGFQLIKTQTFQFGLNNLFVFKRFK
jgi:2-polyprenyl-3-methyl-5-hydroxy-6-metoxy-1,4-benzoquinol methylase